jgi:nitrate reductase NapAB chaperone NapD
MVSAISGHFQPLQRFDSIMAVVMVYSRQFHNCLCGELHAFVAVFCCLQITAVKNEALDVAAVVAQYQREVAALKAQLAALSGKQRYGSQDTAILLAGPH